MMLAKATIERLILSFLILILIHFSVLAQNADEPYRMKTIVLDAGHGGKDPGNLGTGRYKTKEKDIALDVALRVGDYIKKQFPEVNVVYTRSTDVFIGLNERADIANKAKADLFMSIHCNAATNKSAYGVETYALGLHKNKENLDVAMKENSAIFLEDDYKTKYEGFDPSSAESIIALTIMQSAFLQQSLSISSNIQQQFQDRVGRKNRGVKQAGFLVLRKTTMPSILIELGFLTNNGEEDFLNSENGKAYMASAIFRGFKDYKSSVEDPLPEGYELPPPAVNEEQLKQEELDSEMESAAKAKQEAIVEKQARIKAVSDSLQRAKKKLLEEKKQREAELKLKREKDEKARLKAAADSLELVKQQKMEDMLKRQKEIAAEAAKEEAEKIAAQQAAEEEKQRKALEAKQNATSWLEEIKAEKERELAEAQAKASLDSKKTQLEIIEPDKARKQAMRDSLHAMVQTRIKASQTSDLKKPSSQLKQVTTTEDEENIAVINVKKAQEAKQAAERVKVRKDSIRLAQLERAKRLKIQEDSLVNVRTREKLRVEEEKRRQDSIAVVRKAKQDGLKTKIGNEKATTAEEAELLFLQLRKKQLEQRIAKLKGQNVSAPTKDEIVKRTAAKPSPADAVNSGPTKGIVLRVQVMTSSNPLSNGDYRLKGQKAWEYQQGGLYKYTVGSTNDFEEITKLQSDLRNLGFQGAFVVAFKDGIRIKVSEARKILKGE